MPTPQQIAQALKQVKDHPTLIQHLLADTLGWPIEDKVENIEEISFGWTGPELQAQGLEEHVIEDILDILGTFWDILDS